MLESDMMDPRLERAAPARGEMARRIAAHDWSASPLGAREQWPSGLRSAVEICLHSPLPMCVWWGPQLLSLYNDAYTALLADRHPEALGEPAPLVWFDAWEVLRPEAEAVLRLGAPTWSERVRLMLDRRGRQEEAFFSWACSPLVDERGAVAGLLATFLDETGRHHTERALAETQRKLDAGLLAGEVGTFEWDVVGDRLWGDRNFTNIFGIPLDASGAAPLATYLSAVHPDDRDCVVASLRRSVETGCDYQAEYRVISNGRTRWVLARGKPERDAQGRAARFPGVVLDVTDRRTAEEALRQSEAKYRALFDSLDDGFCVLEVLFDARARPVDYRFLEGNPAWERHTGLYGALGKTAREVLPDLEEHWFEIYGKVARTREPIRFESGSEVMGRWFEVYAFPVEEPETRRVALLFKNITDRKRSEQALHESRERFRSVLENSLDAAYRRDLRTDTYDYLSPAVEQIFGMDTEVMRAMSVPALLEYVHPEDRGRITAAIDGGMKHGRGRVEYRFRRPNGDYRWLADHFTVQRDETGKPILRTGTVRDITDQKESDTAARRAAELDAYRLSLNDALRPLTDPAEIQAAASRLLGQQLGVSRVHYAEVSPAGAATIRGDYRAGVPSITGMHQLSSYGPALLGAFMAGRTVVVDDVTAEPGLSSSEVAAFGGIQVAAYIAVPLIKADQLSGLLVVHHVEPRAWTEGEVALVSETAERTWEAVERGRTELERERLLGEAEAARADAEAANRAKADFLAAMSHELRTPLNAIGGYVDLLALGIHGPVTEAQRTALSRITANQRHLLSLINDILQFAKVEAGQVELDLRPLGASELLLSIEPLVAPTAAKRGIAFSIQEADPELAVLADEERVRQIVLNLVTNGIKFTPSGGWVLLSCDGDADGVNIRVRDNGRGIAREKQSSIFDPFVQVDRRLNQPHDGVGLGLAISRDLARAMGGDLVVESTPGHGSLFTLHLPRASAAARAEAEHP